jgi:hypothetical protein
MSKFKNITHWAAGAFVAVVGFAVSPAGQAIVAQYPKLSAVATLLGLLGALYHSPKSPA